MSQLQSCQRRARGAQIPQPFQALAINVALTGGPVSFVWTGRTNGINYEWYATVEDAAGNMETTTTWRFKTLNLNPVATNQNRTVTGDAATILVLTVGDPNGDALTFHTNTLPQHGVLQSFDAAAGLVTYIPARGYRGSDHFTFSAGGAPSGAQRFYRIKVVS